MFSRNNGWRQKWENQWKQSQTHWQHINVIIRHVIVLFMYRSCITWSSFYVIEVFTLRSVSLMSRWNPESVWFTRHKQSVKQTEYYNIIIVWQWYESELLTAESWIVRSAQRLMQHKCKHWVSSLPFSLLWRNNENSWKCLFVFSL